MSYLTVGLYISVRSSRYAALGKFGEHERCLRVARGVLECSPNFPSASYLDERKADVRTSCVITFSTRWFKCNKRVNIPSATLQRVDNFVSGKHFALL